MERATQVLVDEFATRKGHHYATIVLDAKSGQLLSIVPGRDVTAITAALQGIAGDVRSVVSDFAPAMAKAVAHVFPDAKHVLDRFHLIQFFTDALRRRRRFLNEARRHHHVRVIDRALACRPETLSPEDREVADSCLREDPFTRDLYQGLPHIRYVLKATCHGQAKRRLTDWLDRYQSHPCGLWRRSRNRSRTERKRCVEQSCPVYRTERWKERTTRSSSSNAVVMATETSNVSF